MSTIIKAGDAGPVLERLSTVDLADHLAEARTVVEEARHRASEIGAQTQRERARIFEEVRQTGYQAGYEQGHREGTEAGCQAAHQEAIERFEREHTNLTSDMRRAIEDIDTIKGDLQIKAEGHLLDFAVMVARKLTFEIGRLHRESAVQNLSRALRLVGSKTDLTIRVHPDDIESMETFAKSVLQQADASRAVKLAADDSLTPGGCMVSTDRTSIDATLETQVDEMISLLLGEKTEDARPTMCE